MKKFIGILFITGFLVLPGLSFAQHVDVVGTAKCAIITQNIGLGSSGNNVKLLQVFLNKNQNSNLIVSGNFGSLTVPAVKIFQSAHGISPTGYVGLLTRAQIKAIDCSR